MVKSAIINALIKTIATFPGLGTKSATKIALYLITQKPQLSLHLGSLLQELHNVIHKCHICNNIAEEDPCDICCNSERNKDTICIVESIDALWNIEQSGHYKGLYHVLEGSTDSSLNSSEGIASEINCSKLLERLNTGTIKEVILANSPTVAGQISVFYITELIEKEVHPIYPSVKVTRLGMGLPIGSEVNYLDEGTLLAAFKGRKIVDSA